MVKYVKGIEIKIKHFLAPYLQDPILPDPFCGMSRKHLETKSKRPRVKVDVLTPKPKKAQGTSK